MTLSHAREILDFWQEYPPENEMLCLLAQVYTTWKPKGEMTAQDHQRSLEARWAAGAMNPQQILAAMGGTGGEMTMDGRVVPDVTPLP